MPYLISINTGTFFIATLGWIAAILMQASEFAKADQINPQNAPKCSVKEGASIEETGNAGCLIRMGKRVLMPRHRPSGTWNLPGGTQEPGETAQCTAHRETWEETGLDTRVGKLIERFENGFYLFECEPKKPLTATHLPLPLPEWSKKEVTEIRLLDPGAIQPKDYRFPKQLRKIKEFSTR